MATKILNMIRLLVTVGMGPFINDVNKKNWVLDPLPTINGCHE
jgi:hypothetical protein